MNNRKLIIPVSSLLLVTVIYILVTKLNTDLGTVDQPLAINTHEKVKSNLEKIEAPIRKEKKQLIRAVANQLTSSKSSIDPEELIQLNFNNASNAAQAQSIIDETYKDGNGDLAKALEHRLYGQCANSDFFTSMQSQNTEWLKESVQSYCDSYIATVSHEEFSSRALSLTEIVRKRRSTKNLVKQAGDTEKMKIIANAIIHASSREELMSISLLWYKALQSNPSASLSQLQYPYISSNDYLSDIYIASFDLYGCYKFGGCESNQYYIMWVCAMSGQCQPGWSVYDYYENVLSLNELENVLIILQYLFDQQVGG